MLNLLLNPEVWNQILIVITILTPMLSIVLSIIFRKNIRDFIQLEVFWILTFSGPLVMLLWIIFNYIENKFGLDSLPALLLNMLIFSFVGLVTSILLKRSARKIPEKDNG